MSSFFSQQSKEKQNVDGNNVIFFIAKQWKTIRWLQQSCCPLRNKKYIKEDDNNCCYPFSQ